MGVGGLASLSPPFCLPSCHGTHACAADCGGDFVDKSGAIKQELMPDGVHPAGGQTACCAGGAALRCMACRQGFEPGCPRAPKAELLLAALQGVAPTCC